MISDIKILAHLLESRKKSVQEIAKSSLISMPMVKSRVERHRMDRLTELDVIKKSIIRCRQVVVC